MSNETYWPTYMRNTDMYSQWHEWSLFNHHRNGDSLILQNAYECCHGNLIIKDQIHPTWRIVYSLAHKLRPTSIFDFGFGAGNHLINIATVTRATHVSGCELSRRSIDIGNRLFRLNLYDYDLYCEDFLNLVLTRKYDLVYTMTVLMHLPHYMIAPCIKKMVSISNRHVLIMDWFYEGYTLEQIETFLGSFGKIDRLTSPAIEELRRANPDTKYGYLLTKHQCVVG